MKLQLLDRAGFDDAVYRKTCQLPLLKIDVRASHAYSLLDKM